MWRLFERGEKRIFRKMGYYSDQDGILSRFSKEAGNWKEHLEKTKAFILTSANSRQKKKAAILGSGWLLDLPLKELCGYFEEIWLFDIRHSAFVKDKARKLKNVKLVETDISGFAVPIYNTLKGKGHKNDIDWNHINPTKNFDLENFDFVVSCNLLDQLDAIPVDFLIKQNKIREENHNSLRKKIQQFHLDSLPRSKSCVIADVEELHTDHHGKISGIKKLLYTEIAGMKNIEKWTWKFDSHNTYHSEYQTWFSVIAFEL